MAEHVVLRVALRTFGSAMAEPFAVWLITTPSELMVVRVGIPRTPSLAANARLRVASPKGIAAQGISLKYLIKPAGGGGGEDHSRHKMRAHTVVDKFSFFREQTPRIYAVVTLSRHGTASRMT